MDRRAGRSRSRLLWTTSGRRQSDDGGAVLRDLRLPRGPARARVVRRRGHQLERAVRRELGALPERGDRAQPLERDDPCAWRWWAPTCSCPHSPRRSAPGTSGGPAGTGSRRAPRKRRAPRSGIAFLERHNGPALCEDLALCFWAKKADRGGRLQHAAEHPAAAGPTRPRSFGSSKTTTSARLQIEAAPRDLGGGATEALRRHYRIDHEGVSGSYLLPR